MLKEIIISAIETLPNDATLEEILDRIYVAINVNKGLEDVKNGKEITHEEFVKEMEQKWSYIGQKQRNTM